MASSFVPVPRAEAAVREQKACDGNRGVPPAWRALSSRLSLPGRYVLAPSQEVLSRILWRLQYLTATVTWGMHPVSPHCRCPLHSCFLVVHCI